MGVHRTSATEPLTRAPLPSSPMTGTTLARRERDALCDTALTLGPDAPTLCDGWDARDLVAHLLVRERRPWAAVGIVVPPLSGLVDRAMARESRTDYAVMVERLRRRGLSPYTLPVLEQVLNTLEYFVHHEDLRRAQPGWVARELEDGEQDLLWRLLTLAGRVLVRRAGVPVRVSRADRPDTDVTLRRGHDPVVLTGRPSELALFLFGRHQVADVDAAGPIDSAEKLRGSLGF